MALQLSQLGQLSAAPRDTGMFKPGDLTESALRALFTRMTFESNVTPRIQIEDPFGGVDPSWIGSMVKPQITFYSPQFGTKVIRPWGAPSPSSFPLLVGTLAVTLGVLSYYAWKGARG
jgi:hypothetical protein